MAGSRYVQPYAYQTDAAGVPIPGAWLFSYLTGSSTPAPTYADAALTTPNTNPVIADATGTFPSIFLDDTLTYKFQMFFPNPGGSPPPAAPGPEVWSADPVVGFGGQTNLSSYTATGGNAITLTPTSGTPTISAYTDYEPFVFLAPSTVTGSVTVKVGSLAFLPLYLGVAQVGAGQLTAGQLVVAYYTHTVNGMGTPGLVMLPNSPFVPVVSSADVGAANAYVMTPTQAITGYSSSQLFLLPAATANTGPSTLNVSGKGVIPITNAAGNALAPGQIAAGGEYLLACTGTSFILLNPSAAVGKCFASAMTASAPGGAASATWLASNAVLTDASGNTVGAGAVNQTVNLAVGGAGGLDTGAVANNTWYAVFLIYGASGQSIVASLSATAPTIPAGYVFSGRVGWVRTDGSGHIVAFKQSGARIQYVNTGSGVPQMATGSTTAAWSAVAWAAFAPATAASLTLYGVRSGGAYVGVAPNGNYATAFASANIAPIWVGANSGTFQTVVGEIVPESSNIYYFGSEAGDGVSILGWTDNF